MDETPVFFDMVPNKSYAKKGSKSVTVRTSGCEEKHLTVFLTIAAYPFFPGKTDRTIKDLTILDNLCVVTQEMAWIDVRLMMV